MEENTTGIDWERVSAKVRSHSGSPSRVLMQQLSFAGV